MIYPGRGNSVPPSPMSPNIPRVRVHLDNALDEISAARDQLLNQLDESSVQDRLNSALENISIIRTTVVSTTYSTSSESSNQTIIKQLSTVSQQLEIVILELARGQPNAGPDEHLERARKELDEVRAALQEQKLKNETLGRNLKDVQAELATARREIVAQNSEVSRLKELVEYYKNHIRDGSEPVELWNMIRKQEDTISKLEVDKRRLGEESERLKREIDEDKKNCDDLRLLNLDLESK
jgi:chromosome segregation ATPase